MGCVFCANPKKPSMLLSKERISGELLNGETLTATRISAAILPEIQSSSEPKQKICLKLQIFEDFQDTFPVSHSLPTSYLSSINHVKKSWITYKSALSYFHLSTHGCCISNFSIVDGVIILLISSLASHKRFNEDIFVHNEPPFISFLPGNENPETEKLIKAWTGLGMALKSFSIKKKKSIEKMVQKFYSLVQNYENFSEEIEGVRKRRKSVGKVIGCCEELIKEVEEAQKELKGFFEGFEVRREELERLGEIAKRSKAYSGELIVHYVLFK